jgi:peptide/nickel transport system permease protein
MIKDIFIGILKDKIGRIGLSGVLIVVLLSLTAPIIAPYSPTDMNTVNKLLPPSAKYIMGTDEFGRDIFSRIVHGAKVSIQVGLISVSIGAISGYILGIAAGYAGGKIDNIIMRVMDILFAFPSLVLALAIVAVLGPSLFNTMIAIGIISSPVFTRTIRAAVISVKNMEYVNSARSVGIGTMKTIIKYISPNIMAPFIVQVTLSLSSAILTEASLSFLGLGIQPPNPSWGSMLNSSRKFMEIAPWTIVFPAIFIICTILSFNILGDSLRDVLDPKLKL